jgi:hypothetical protein
MKLHRITRFLLSQTSTSHAFVVAMNSLAAAPMLAIAPAPVSVSSSASGARATPHRRFAPSVVSSSLRKSDAAPRVTAHHLASNVRTASGGESSGKRRNGVTPNGGAPIGNCAHCGKTMYRKSESGRLPTYCSTNCRVKAFRKRRRAKAQK